MWSRWEGTARPAKHELRLGNATFAADHSGVKAHKEKAPPRLPSSRAVWPRVGSSFFSIHPRGMRVSAMLYPRHDTNELRQEKAPPERGQGNNAERGYLPPHAAPCRRGTGFHTQRSFPRAVPSSPTRTMGSGGSSGTRISTQPLRCRCSASRIQKSTSTGKPSCAKPAFPDLSSFL